MEPGNSVIVDPTGKILAGPARHEETILYAEVDLAAVRAARRFFDPVGHYNRPDIFQLLVDTRPRPSVVQRPQSDTDTPPEAAPRLGSRSTLGWIIPARVTGRRLRPLARRPDHAT